MLIVKQNQDCPAEQIGTKARNLQILQKYFPVPEFVVVATNVWEQNHAQGMIPPSLQEELRKILTPWLRRGKVVVRSSATTEDLAGRSFAGMYKTVLGLDRFENVLGAIKQVWVSHKSKRVAAYRRWHGIAPGKMAVIIQRQLQPETSGIMITRSPFDEDELIIECGPGLGDKLVSGQIPPVRYRVKQKKVTKPDNRGLLSDHQVRELIAAGRRLAEIFTAPQDIEWAYEKNRLYILQARPLTVQETVPRRRGTVWSNVNLRETIPDPITPMGWSLFNDVIFYEIVHWVFMIPVTRAVYDRYPMVERRLGRLYWNLNNCLAYAAPLNPILRIFKLRSLDPQIIEAVKVVDLRQLPRPIPALRYIFWGPWALFRLIRYLLKGFIFHRSISRNVTSHFDKSARWLKHLEVTGELKKGLANCDHWLRSWLRQYGRTYFSSIFIGLFQMMILMTLMKWRLGQKGEVLARKAVVGIIDQTGAMAMALQQLGAMARTHLRRDIIELRDLKNLLAADSGFRQAYDLFLDEFGHRGPGEFDFGKPNWRDDENMTLAVIIAAAKARPNTIDREAEMKKIEKGLTPLACFMFRFFRSRLESLTPLRENGKHHYFKFGRRLKDQMLAIALNLKKNGYLRRPDDIFFLTLSDLERIKTGQLTPTAGRALITQRRREIAQHARLEAPDIIYESGERISTPRQAGTAYEAEPLTFGRQRARARIIADFRQASKLKKGEILVTHHSDPGWTPLFLIASGVIVEVGGLICHAAMVARELGIPAVVLPNATRLIADGGLVELDADEGRVTIICR